MLVCVIPLAPGPSIAKQTKVLEENVIGKYTNLFGASNPHCRYINLQWGKYNIGEGTDARIIATLSISYKYWYKPFISVENASNSMIGYFIKDLNSFLILRGVNDIIARTGFFFTIGN